jgi:hypothetical protein
MVPLYNRAYTNEELEVFRMCIKLKQSGCKTDTEAEPILRRTFWNFRPSALQTLMKQWFYNRQKIDVLLAAAENQTESINNDGLTTQYTTDSKPTNTIA